MLASEHQHYGFITYLKATSALIVLVVHFGTAFFNASPSWAYITSASELPFARDGYPQIIDLLTIWGGQWGFLVTIGVQLFFLAFGFTLIDSVKRHKFVILHKIIKMLPFYAAVMGINMLITLLNSTYYAGLHFRMR